MALFAQHGHGKADKIDTAFSEGSIQGVVLAPRNEKPDNLRSMVRAIAREGHGEVLVDPQLYLSTIPGASLRYLPEYPFFSPMDSPKSMSLKSSRQLAEKAIDFQTATGASSLISPALFISSFDASSYHSAMTLAEFTVEYCESKSAGKRLLLGFVIMEQFLEQREELDRFLDFVTQDGWDMRGFYLVVSRQESAYNQDWDPTRLANLMYLSHVLGGIHKFRVVFGYTDFCGLLLRAAGASAFCTGWSQGQRQFAKNNFVQKDGGRQSRPRYTSGPLLNSIFLQDLQDVHVVGHAASVLSDVGNDAEITSASNPLAATGWSGRTSQLHHWQTLSKLDKLITGEVHEDVKQVLGLVQSAQVLYRTLQAKNVHFDRFTGGNHLANWERAIRVFSRRIGISLP